MKPADDKAEKAERRPDLYIIARFLERLWLDGKEYRKPQLQNAVGLNFNLFTWYLEWMTEKGLITLKSEGASQTVHITKKGLDAYHGFVVWVKDTIGDIGPRKK